MIVEICFLDEAGHLSCSFTAQFLNVDHVTRYVRGLLKTAMMRDRVARAEVYLDTFSIPFVIMGGDSLEAPNSVLKYRIASRVNVQSAMTKLRTLAATVTQINP